MKARTIRVPSLARALALGVLAAVLTLGAGVHAPAFAAPPATLDPSMDGHASLIVHKYAAYDTVGEPGDGLALSPQDEPSDPLAGATFTVYNVALAGGGVLTNAGWQAIADLRQQLGPNPTMAALQAASGVDSVSEVASETTDVSGEAVFANMSFGLYYVVETGAPEGFFPVAPFLVTLPMTNPTDSSSWLYDVNVYPKDRPGPEKEVLDGSSAAPGEAVTWRISSPVPAGKVSGLTLRDQLAPQLLFKQVSRVFVADYSDSPTQVVHTFEEGVDYRVDLSDQPGGGQLAQVVLLQPGLDYLEGVNSARMRVAVDLDTECLEAGLWDNVAEVCDTSVAGTRSLADGEVCLYTNVVKTRWGKLTVLKTDSVDTAKLLAGAQFKLYYSNRDDFAGATDSGYTATTGTDGRAVFQPVRFSDHAMGGVVAPGDDTYLYYWLVEVKAPDGYQVASTPIPLQLVESGADPNGNFTVSVKNVAKPGPGKPPGSGLAETGANVAIFLAAGAGLLAVGSLARRKRNKCEADA